MTKDTYLIAHAYDQESHPEEVNFFVALSAALTGFSAFELYGTGQVLTYYHIIKEHLATSGIEQTLDSIVNGFHLSQTTAQNEQYLEKTLGSCEYASAFIRSVIKLWYLGQWYNPTKPDETYIPSAQSYSNGLVWIAIDAHPQGAKQQGFAAWAVPPQPMSGVSAGRP